VTPISRQEGQAWKKASPHVLLAAFLCSWRRFFFSRCSSFTRTLLVPVTTLPSVGPYNIMLEFIERFFLPSALRKCLLPRADLGGTSPFSYRGQKAQDAFFCKTPYLADPSREGLVPPTGSHRLVLPFPLTATEGLIMRVPKLSDFNLMPRPIP